VDRPFYEWKKSGLQQRGDLKRRDLTPREKYATRVNALRITTSGERGLQRLLGGSKQANVAEHIEKRHKGEWREDGIHGEEEHGTLRGKIACHEG